MKQNTKINFFLDSGAFSAFTRGQKIDIREYMSFIKKYEKYIDYYAVLDVIGDAKKTLHNQSIMERNGLNPIPCFHYGEDISYLKNYLDNYEYIALGGMVPINTESLIVWLDNLFSNYLKNIKIHGFGLTTFEIMKRYPWESVDSTSWQVLGSMGSVLVPIKINSKYNYLQKPHVICVSTNNDRQKTLSHKNREILEEYLAIYDIPYGDEDKKGIITDYMFRWKLNIFYYLELEKQLTDYWKGRQFLKKEKGFFI